MADWSDILEQRLQAALLDSGGTATKKAETAGGRQRVAAGLGLDWGRDRDRDRGRDRGLTPPPTLHRAAAGQHTPAVGDSTRAFFESMRTQSRAAPDGAAASAGGWHGETGQVPWPAVTPAAQTIGSGASASSPLALSGGMQQQPAIKGLQESYSNRARDLHGKAMKRLTDIQDGLEAQLTDLALQEDALLSTAADKQAQFSRPAEAWAVKVQTGGSRGGAPTEERIVDRVAAMRAAADALESDLAQLWHGWGQAQAEATEVLQAMLASGGEDDGDLVLAQAEQELDAAAAEAMKETKENEKKFRKLILDEECKLAQTMLARQSKYD